MNILPKEASACKDPESVFKVFMNYNISTFLLIPNLSKATKTLETLPSQVPESSYNDNRRVWIWYWINFTEMNIENVACVHLLKRNLATLKSRIWEMDIDDLSDATVVLNNILTYLPDSASVFRSFEYLLNFDKLSASSIPPSIRFIYNNKDNIKEALSPVLRISDFKFNVFGDRVNVACLKEIANKYFDPVDIFFEYFYSYVYLTSYLKKRYIPDHYKSYIKECFSADLSSKILDVTQKYVKEAFDANN